MSNIVLSDIFEILLQYSEVTFQKEGLKEFHTYIIQLHEYHVDCSVNNEKKNITMDIVQNRTGLVMKHQFYANLQSIRYVMNAFVSIWTDIALFCCEHRIDVQ